MTDIPDIPPPDPVTYEAAIEAINKPTAKLARSQRRARKWIAIALVAAGLALVAAGFSIAAWVHANRVSDEIRDTAHAARVAQCQTGNQFRRGDLQLWQTVLALPTGPQTPQQQANRVLFVKFLTVHDALIDCSKIP